MIEYDQIRRIHIEPSSVCNAACPNCPRNVAGGYKVPGLIEEVMSLDALQLYLSPKDLRQLDQIRFCGNYGDPATCPDLPLMVQWIMDVNSSIRIEINTNGGVRKPIWWAGLALHMSRNPENSVIFSIDGLEKTNEMYRRKVKWENLEANFRAYISAGGRAIWEMLVFSHNELQTEEARQRAADEAFVDFRLKNPFGFNNTYDSKPFMLVRDELGRYDYGIFPKGTRRDNKVVPLDVLDPTGQILPEEYKAIQERAYQQNDPKYAEYMDSRPQGIDCMTARDQEVYISANGELYPCCFLGHASQHANIGIETVLFHNWLSENVGFGAINLLGNTMEEIVSSDYFRKIQESWSRSHSEGRVAMCTLMCSSDCKLNTMKNLYDKEAS